MYSADALAAAGVSVDVFDRLPIPFGLVRYGVAPDHFSIRSVRDTLDKTWAENVRYLGNVEIGTDISVEELSDYYDAVVFTYGAARDRKLGIPGEDLAGSIAATDFVNWYCGHPDADRVTMESLLGRVTSAAIIGVGNVAVDVTRVLAKTAPELEATDMPQHVLDCFAQSGVTDVYLIGRRGPAQGAFTTKELRELGELADADVIVDPADVILDAVSEAHLAGNKVATRNVDVIREWSTRTPAGKNRRIHVLFYSMPVAIEGETEVTGLVLERTRLTDDGRAVGTGEQRTIPVDLVVRSVGYRGTPLPPLPFDADRNVIPSEDGRVIDDGTVRAGAYVAGWIKRGPTGIIGTNKKDAAATVASLLEDLPNLPKAAKRSPSDVDALLADRGVTVVTTQGWRRIDDAERAAGQQRGRDRMTLVDRDVLIKHSLGN